MELFKASRQWQTRPQDQRFTSLQQIYDVTKAYADQAKEKSIPFTDLRVEANNNEVQLVGKAKLPAWLTHWAFGQLCGRVGAPASYLRELPATLAAQNLNHGLAHRDKGDVAQLMFHTNGGLLLRAITSDQYSRIWNWEVAERLLTLQERGWEPAVPDIRKAVKVEPALYASDHDMFCFVRNQQCTIKEAGSTEPLQRGVIVENSEVGASALKLTRFLYRVMCGNHIIWGASKVLEISLRHVGSVRERFGMYAAELKRYAESSPSDEEAKIASAKRRMIAATKEQLLDKLFGIRSIGVARKTLDASYDAIIPAKDGDPKSVWGFVQGMTRHSQTIPYADQRTHLDKAAGRLMEIDF